MTNKTLQFHISRLEREKDKRTKCIVKIASFHLRNKHASSADINNAKRLIQYLVEYCKLDEDKEKDIQVLKVLKNKIAFLNDCLRMAIKKDSSGEFIDLLELEELENNIKEGLLMKERVSFDSLPRVDVFHTPGLRRKVKLSIVDKVLFDRSSRNLNSRKNEFIPKKS